MYANTTINGGTNECNDKCNKMYFLQWFLEQLDFQIEHFK